MNNLVVVVLVLGSSFYLVKGFEATLKKSDLWMAIGLVTFGVVSTHFLVCTSMGYGEIYSAYMILGTLLLLLAVSDATTYQLPTDLLIFGLVAGVILVILAGGLKWYMNILVATGVFFLIIILRKILRGGLGEGDAYVVAMIALYLGGMHMLVVVLVGLLLSSVVGIGMMIFAGKSRKTVLPFVPFIAVAHIGVLLFW